MRAILINPERETVEEVEYRGGIDHIYELIDANCFSVATINEQNDGIFVDDEGLLTPQFYAFDYEDYPQPLAGHGLILGCDYEGSTIEPSVSLQEVRSKVSFRGLCHLE